MKLESPINVFVLFIIFIKIVFILTAIGHVILTHMSGNDETKEQKRTREEDHT